MKVTLLDTHTGETRKTPVVSAFSYAENNWSCDCNRASFFGNSDSSQNCIGAHRYLVIAAEFDEGEHPYTLRELNQDYPEELLAKHLPTMIPIDITPTPEAIKLPSVFDAALIGATVSIHGSDRFAYSLKNLIGLTMLERQVQEPEARQIIVAEFIIPLGRKHGPESPVWIDDTLLEEPTVVDDSPKIIVPKKLSNRRWSS